MNLKAKEGGASLDTEVNLSGWSGSGCNVRNAKGKTVAIIRPRPGFFTDSIFLDLVVKNLDATHRLMAVCMALVCVARLLLEREQHERDAAEAERRRQQGGY